MTPKKPTPPPGSPDRLLTLADVALFLQLNEKTVRAFVKRRELRGHLLGRRWRFSREDVARFLENTPCSWEFSGKRVSEE